MVENIAGLLVEVVSKQEEDLLLKPVKKPTLLLELS